MNIMIKTSGNHKGWSYPKAVEMMVLSLVICHLSSVIWWVIWHQSYIIDHLTWVIQYKFSVFSFQSSVIRLQSSFFMHNSLSYIICYQSSVTWNHLSVTVIPIYKDNVTSFMVDTFSMKILSYHNLSSFIIICHQMTKLFCWYYF